MLKVRKKAKYDLHLRVDISQTTTVSASKSGVILSLVLSNIFSKSGVLTTNGVEMLKVRKKLNVTLIYMLISHELHQLGHPNLV